MNKFLLFASAAMLTASPIFAEAVTTEPLKVAKQRINAPAKAKSGTIITSENVTKGVQSENIELTGGLKTRRLNAPGITSNIINPNNVKFRSPEAKSPEARQGYSLYEDFEEWDGKDIYWLPEGWSVDRKVSEKGHVGWYMRTPGLYDDFESTCPVFNYFDDPVDEWLITPEIKVEAGMELAFTTYNSALYYFDWDYVDWANGSVFTELNILNDFRINISDDGGKTWKTIKSLAEDIKASGEKQYFVIYYEMGFRNYILPLDEYVGKDIMIGFQVVGEGDGNSAMVDNVRVSLPPVSLSYQRPLSGLWFGLTKDDLALPASVFTVPVHGAVKFNNLSQNNEATYHWNYSDSKGNEFTSDEQKTLTVTYTTNHATELDSRNNWQTMPVLYGSAPGMASGEFTYNHPLQAGGRGEYEIKYVDSDESEILDFGLTVVDPMTEGTATWADFTVPYFGYNNQSDRFWTYYTFQGDDGPSDYTHLEKIGNFFYSPETPMVINGIRMNAYGKISRKAVFKAEIYPLNIGYAIAKEPIATAICTGDDIYIVDQSSYKSNDDISLIFKFDEPVVISSKVTPYFIVFISGFRDAENVEYFSPEMSATSNPNNLGLGWAWVETAFTGQVHSGQVPVSNITEDLVAFYIMLDADLPWLQTAATEHTTSADAPTTLTVDSFHGENLTFEDMPDWLTATVSGRYDKTVITFTSTNREEATAAIKIVAPGISTPLTINNTRAAGISNIIADKADGEETIFTISGQRVANVNVAPGIYIVRKADGTSRKVIIR